MSESHDLIEIAANGATFRLFNEVTFAEIPSTIPVFPKPGTYQHGSYGEIALTPERIANFVSNFNNVVYQKHIPIDAEHQTKLSGALGYINHLVVQDDGRVDATVDWTDRGQKLVASDRFKYVSPEWYDRWDQPDTDVQFQDVLVGLALTTRPFFKDANDSLRPLVAREGELIVPPDDPTKEGANAGMPTHTTESSKEKPVAENESKTMSEDVARQFTELEGKVATLTQQFTEAQTAREAAESRVAALEAARQDRELRDQVKAFSLDADTEHHVEMLKALPDDKRAAYIANETRTTAALKNSNLFREIGSDSNAAGDGSAEAALDARAKALMASESIDYASAYLKAFNDPDLRHKLAVERKGGN